MPDFITAPPSSTPQPGCYEQRRLKVHADTMGKHMKVLRRVKREGAAGRVKEFQIPAEFRATAEVMDFGVCRVQLGL